MDSRTCHGPDCENKLTGRTDQRFCSDNCRANAYNNLNRDNVNFIRRVNNILKKNRRILADLNPNGKSKVSKIKLDELGFNFNYYTNTYITKQGKTYYFCYDQGYLSFDEGWYALVVKQDYVS